MIQFNRPAVTGKEKEYMAHVFENQKFCGKHEFTKQCNRWLKNLLDSDNALTTPSCTHALEMAAILINIKQGDEVIMSSYGFSSTANAFILRGARIVFVDIRPDTMNIDERLIEPAITEKTRAIVVMHYAGVACEMDVILDIAEKHRIVVIEDAAQALLSSYKGKKCGSFGKISCFSFHETKNIQCGEGGAIIINDANFSERAEIIQEKGTDRSKFYRGEIDKYTWIDIGSSFLPSELTSAFLLAQLEMAENITNNRLNSWDLYHQLLKPMATAGFIEMPKVSKYNQHNGHIFYIKTQNQLERSNLINHLKKNSIQSVFHYIPLHSSQAGKKFSRFHGSDKWTTMESERLLRLPLYYNMDPQDIHRVVKEIKLFYQQ